MSKINTGRVILGGLVAGLVINIGEYLFNGPLMGEQIQAQMAALNLNMSSNAMPFLVGLAFLGGIVMIWLYAAARPRLGAGPKTAIQIGLATWFLLYVWGYIGWWLLGIITTKVLLLGDIWGLFELPIATLAGAWIYKEE